jgi:Mlc titration factor MtfA (ptsG expression regulator)
MTAMRLLFSPLDNAPTGPLNEWLVLLSAAALLAAAWLSLGPLVRASVRRTVGREQAAPIPPAWLPLIDQHVPAVRDLTPEQRSRLLAAARELLTTVHWEGCGGLALTEEMRLVIAAQACVLTLERPGERYPTLRNVLVYPGTFVPRRAVDLRKWHSDSVRQREVPELGESWNNGTVVVAWDDAVAGAGDPGDGRNVVFHEFAHQLDFEHHLAATGSSIPVLMGNRDAPGPKTPEAEAWQRVLEESYERLCSEVDRGAPTVLDPYAVTNEAEFFAVATEVFFEQPRELRAAYPALYAELQQFYRQDPAGRAVHAAGA